MKQRMAVAMVLTCLLGGPRLGRGQAATASQATAPASTTAAQTATNAQGTAATGAQGTATTGTQGTSTTGDASRAVDLRTDKQKALAKQTERLLDMATELKVQVDKTNKNILSLTVVQKAQEIEALARGMKEQAKK
jgi:type IV secretory pathway TrbL component